MQPSILDQQSFPTEPWQVPEHAVIELGPRQTRYCLCLPVYNEGDRLRTQLTRMHSTTSGVDLVLSDGGSDDGSTDPDFLRRVGVRALLVDRTDGKYSSGARIGFAWAMLQGYDGVVLMDGNNKDGEEAIPAFLAALDAGYDLVQGSRFLPGGHHAHTPLARLLGIRWIASPAVSLAARTRYTDVTNGFKAFSRRLLLDRRLQVFRDEFTRYEILFYVASRAPRLGFRTREIPVRRVYPAQEVPTKITFAGNFAHLKVFADVLLGRYDPR